MLDNLLIIIVMYNKSISEVPVLKLAQSSIEHPTFLIYDNSLLPQALENTVPNIIYHHDPTNPGVSAAYNFGFKYAVSIGKSVVLILDQDTDFKVEYLSKYLDGYNESGDDYIYAPVICDEHKTKIYSPSILNNFIGAVTPYNERTLLSKKMSLKKKSVINSGLLIPVALFERVGGYNEKIKLDFSDIFFIEKYKKLNEFIIIIDAEFTHRLSGDEGHNYAMEIPRFRFYCNGARELSNSLNVSTWMSVTRRMLRLSLKYMSLAPASVFFKYYILGRDI